MLKCKKIEKYNKFYCLGMHNVQYTCIYALSIKTFIHYTCINNMLQSVLDLLKAL